MRNPVIHSCPSAPTVRVLKKPVRTANTAWKVSPWRNSASPRATAWR